MHDARVLANSPLYGFGQSGTLFPPDKTEVINGVRIPVVIIGDATYPLLEWLMKPYADNGRLSPSQRAFNNNLSSTRMAKEIAFGRLKGRWRILLKRLDMKKHGMYHWQWEHVVPFTTFVIFMVSHLMTTGGQMIIMMMGLVV